MSAPLAAVPKLDKFILLLASDQPGEVTAAAAAATRALRAAGLDWHDVVSALKAPANTQHQPHSPRPRRPQSPSEKLAAELRAIVGHHALNDWECGFVESVLDQLMRGRAVSEKQKTVLDRLLAKTRKGSDDA